MSDEFKKIKEADPEFLISQYLDGQLSRRKAARLERQLAEDPELREQLRRYTAVADHLSAMGPRELEAVDYDAQRGEVIAALERKVLIEGLPSRRLMFRPMLGAVAAAAAVIVIATTTVLYLTPGPQPPPQAQPIVAMAVIPVAAADVGGGELIVESRLIPSDEFPLAPPMAPGGSADIPAGTILVSTSPPAGGAPLTISVSFPMMFD